MHAPDFTEHFFLHYSLPLLHFLFIIEKVYLENFHLSKKAFATTVSLTADGILVQKSCIFLYSAVLFLKHDLTKQLSLLALPTILPLPVGKFPFFFHAHVLS